MLPVLALLSSFVPTPVHAGIAPGLNRHFLERGQHIALLEQELELQQVFDRVRSTDHEGRAAVIEPKLARLFPSLPKRADGRLGSRALRFLVHQYFLSEHGWLLTGLEHHGHHPETTGVHEANIVKDKAPDLADAVCKRHDTERGLIFDDVVALVAAMEQMVMDDSRELLGTAYYLNGRAKDERLDEAAIDEVLFSYLIMYEMGETRSLLDIADHMEMKKRARSPDVEMIFDDLLCFQNDTVRSSIYEDRHRLNPFVEKPFTFQDATRMVTKLVETYSSWQDQECWRMKEHLVAMSNGVSGVLPLATFYSEQGASEYRFSESQAYLQQIGALDEATGTVRIANYMMGPSNCLASSEYVAVCCLSECDRLMNELMTHVQAPIASPDMVLRLVTNMSTSTREGPWLISEEMEARLQRIADRNDGVVPLHSRRFSQWMHNAFPYDCPYPHQVHDNQVLTINRWKDTLSAATDSEIERIVQAEEMQPNSTRPQEPTWVENVEETMPLLDPPRAQGSLGYSLFRVGIQSALLLVALRTAFSWWRAAASALASTSLGTPRSKKPVPTPGSARPTFTI